MTVTASDTPPRFILGIDLGTTNSSVAFVDTAAEPWVVRDFLVPQLVAPSTVEAREVLPSFHYEAAPGEFPAGALRLPWSADDPNHAVGLFARDHGAAVPARLVVSAKSWLCHTGVDRTAGLLPWHGAPDVTRLSPVEVSARYLAHVRAAWDHAHPDHPLAEQEVVLTVPASFDEVARELTVEAARAAGLVRLVLVEEPQAAFYAWIDAQGDAWASKVEPGQKILVADVGGGTTDLTLIRVKPAGGGGAGGGGGGGKVLFHRVAVGQHLILGGDNLDLAVAQHAEAKLTGGGKLPPREWGQLLRAARAAKETLLSDDAPERVTLTLGGGGSKLVGGARTVELHRDELRALLLEGFLPSVPLDAKPLARRSGFQEFALPYAPDPAITKYLAAFLTAHRDAEPDEHTGALKMHADPARPDLVLFNGGFFASPVLRQRFLDVLCSWFSTARRPWRPVVLDNVRLDLAVSRGAAYYGTVRRGRGVRIKGGLAHSYYVGVEGAAPASPPPEPTAARESAVCLLPAGVEEGQDVRLARPFQLLIRQPVEFPLYYSATRTTDAPGALVEVDGEQLSALPPIRTVLQSGRRTAADSVPVHLFARLTEIGTLELWAQETRGDRQWRLEFDVRSASRAEVAEHVGLAEMQGFVDASVLPPARALITQAFAEAPAATSNPQLPAPATPPTLVKRLELVTGLSRSEWPASLMRSFWETLIEVQEGRKRSVEHEARWLNLTGFCLRPGYGLAVDDFRVAQTWKLFPSRVTHAKNELVRAEWWILWRRLAGGLSAGQQLTLAESLVPAVRSRLRAAGPFPQPRTSAFQYGPHETAEVYRLLGSLELLPPTMKQSIADTLLALLPKDKPPAVKTAALFALGRIGSRVPVYGPLNALLPAESAESLASAVIATGLAASPEPAVAAQALFCLVQLTRRTDDRYRDVSDAARQQVLAHLASAHAKPHYLTLVRDGGSLEGEEQKLTFGETLPRGLRIE